MIRDDTTNTELIVRRHIGEVREELMKAVSMLLVRAAEHDASKLEEPEFPIFSDFSPKLRHSTYASQEYNDYKVKMKPALDHHYAVNRHHPEFFKEEGVNGMSLIDLTEMICDWAVASRGHDDGDVVRSLVINMERFGIGMQLGLVLLNTIFGLNLGGSPTAWDGKYSEMANKPETPKVGVGVALERDNKVCLLKRIGSHGAGKWSFPGGHQEIGETFLQCVSREVMEELGVVVDDVHQIGFANNDMDDEGLHYVTLFFLAVWDESQEPKICEPDKASEIGWFSPNDPPTPIFGALADLFKTYAYGWPL